MASVAVVSPSILLGETVDRAEWIIPCGQAISRSVYHELFSVLGTTYGAGDGMSTFCIPDAQITQITFQSVNESAYSGLMSSSPYVLKMRAIPSPHKVNGQELYPVGQLLWDYAESDDFGVIVPKGGP